MFIYFDIQLLSGRAILDSRINQSIYNRHLTLHSNLLTIAYSVFIVSYKRSF